MINRPIFSKRRSLFRTFARSALCFGCSVVAFAVIASGTIASGAHAEDLTQFSRSIGLKDTASFVETVSAIRSTGRLPNKYLTKQEASRKGWRPGANICEAIPNQWIGGDVFRNLEGRLPKKNYREADLEPTCKSRGAKRLVFSGKNEIYVTVDHYETFTRVP
ncbi:Ribonuclease [Azospirillaceae bacterium]